MEDRKYPVKAYLYDQPELNDQIQYWSNDTDSCSVEIAFYSTIKDIFSLENKTVSIVVTKPDGTSVTAYASVTGENTALWQLNTNELTVGTNKATIQVYSGTERLTFGSFKYKVLVDPESGQVGSENNYPILVQLINDVQTALNSVSQTNENISQQELTREQNEIIRVSNETDRINRFNEMTTKQQQDMEVVDARQGKATLRDNIQEVKSQLALKRDNAIPLTNADLDVSMDANKLKLVNLSDEVKQAMAGATSINATPANGSLVKEKFAPTSISKGHTNFLITGKNLFDQNTAVSGYRLNSSTGILEANINYYVSDYIPVLPNTQYVRVWGEYVTAFYDNQYNLISFTVSGHNMAFSTPVNCVFIRLSIYNTVVSSEQLEIGSTPTTYEPFGIQFSNVKYKSIDSIHLTDNAKNYFKQDMFPFQYLANFNNNLVAESEIRSAIKKIELYGADITKKYCLGIIQRNFSTYGTGAYIYECDSSGNGITVVAVTSKNSYIEPTGIDVFTLAEFGGSGITAKLYIDWSKITTNKQYVNTHFDKTGLDIRTYINQFNDNVKINLPSKLYAVVGDTLEIFYKGIIQAINPFNYNIKVVSAKGNAYSKRYIYTPMAGDTDFTITFSVYNNNNQLMATKTVTVVVSPIKNNPASIKNVLCVGDSLLGNGVWAVEMKRRIVDTGGLPVGNGLSNIRFIGSLKSTIDNTVGYEGYGGWKWESFNSNIVPPKYWVTVTSGMKTDAISEQSVWSDGSKQWKLETRDIVNNKLKFKQYPDGGSYTMPTSGTLTFVSGGGDTSVIIFTNAVAEAGNPFWNTSASKLDFINYCTKINVTQIDYCYVLLGWNNQSTTKDQLKIEVKKFVDQLHADYPSCKIALCGIQVPSIDGLGANYGANASWNFYERLQKVFEINDTYYEISQESAYSGFVDFVNIASQFDTDNNMMTETRPVNVRSSKTEAYGINGVHPDTTGYMQIADVNYRHMMSKL